MSIIRTALAENRDSQVVLAYGNQSPKQTMFRAEIEQLQSEYPGRFTVYYLFSRDREEGSLFGRIEPGTVNFITRNKHRDLSFDRFYLCGPQAMIEMAETTLIGQGIAKDRVSHELFTEAEGTDTLKEELEGKTTLTVLLDGVSHELVMDQKSLVLDAVIRAKIDAPYSCQGGVCSTCIARVTEGSASMVKNQILTPGEVAEGLILTCQAHPTTPVLKVDYDDV
jgi:ring-1,2-phenylacetyl-CoA epoxidase subunit PaaE